MVIMVSAVILIVLMLIVVILIVQMLTVAILIVQMPTVVILMVIMVIAVMQMVIMVIIVVMGYLHIMWVKYGKEQVPQLVQENTMETIMPVQALYGPHRAEPHHVKITVALKQVVQM